MKKIYLHIGLHKTGSTYIQKIFTDNRELLREFGVEYPELGAEFLFGHHNFAWSFIPDKCLQDGDRFTVEKLLESLHRTPAETIFISSEDFDFLQLQHIKSLARTLEGFQVQIVLYARHPAEMLYSLWQERIKHGDTISLPSYYDSILQNPRQIDYRTIANLWSGIFGEQSISIIIYDNLRESNTDIAFFLLNEVMQLNIDFCQLKKPDKKINPSSSIEIIEILRRINGLSKDNMRKNHTSVKFIQFLNTSPLGRTLKHDLDNLARISSEFLDISQLNPLFGPENKAFSMPDRSIKNPYSEKQVFRNRVKDELKIGLIAPDLLEKKVDIDELYRFYTAKLN